MCLSCGCGQPNDDHGDSRNITLNDIDQAAKAAGTTRDKVLQNITGGTGPQQTSSSSASSVSNGQQGNTDQSSGSFLPADQPPTKPGQKAPQLGTESGTDWQESQQMGNTGRGGIQNPQAD